MATSYLPNQSQIEMYIIKNEAFSRHPYPDRGDLSIGYGRNLTTNGISESEALILLRQDIYICFRDLADIFGMAWLCDLPGDKRTALIDMRYNLGPGGFRSFENMIESVRNYQWLRASQEILDSLYAKQVPDRANRNAEIIMGSV